MSRPQNMGGEIILSYYHIAKQVGCSLFSLQANSCRQIGQLADTANRSLSLKN